MLNNLKVFLVVIFSCTILYFIIGYASSYIGWYGYKKWQYRVGTSNIEESKKRGVFVRELHFKIDSFTGPVTDFRPYIEKGFKYGLHSSEETVPLVNSNYPYTLSFHYKRSAKFGVLIRESELKKFDSSGDVWGYLKYPHLKDTIILDLGGENIRSGIIKVWE